MCVFGSHTLVPISSMCKEINFIFTQFSRIRNHLFGRWIEIGGQHVVNCDKDHGPNKRSSQTVLDLHPSIVECIELTKVQIADQHVGCNTSSGLSAHLCSAALQRETSRPQHPYPRASCAMVAKTQSLATSAVAGDERDGETEATAQPESGMVVTQSGPYKSVKLQEAEANGPHNSSQCAAWSCSSKVLLVACCQPWACWVLAATRARVETLSNPASCSAGSQLVTAWKQRAGLGSMPSMTMFATTGCLSLIILMLSAQLDQCTATLAPLTSAQVLLWTWGNLQ